MTRERRPWRRGFHYGVFPAAHRGVVKTGRSTVDDFASPDSESGPEFSLPSPARRFNFRSPPPKEDLEAAPSRFCVCPIVPRKRNRIPRNCPKREGGWPTSTDSGPISGARRRGRPGGGTEGVGHARGPWVEESGEGAWPLVFTTGSRLESVRGAGGSENSHPTERCENRAQISRRTPSRAVVKTLKGKKWTGRGGDGSSHPVRRSRVGYARARTTFGVAFWNAFLASSTLSTRKTMRPSPAVGFVP